MFTPVTISILMGLCALALILTAVVLAFRYGWRAGAGYKIAHFERLPAEIDLMNTVWEVLFDDLDSAGQTQEMRGILRFRQMGSRITAEGDDEAGHHWTAEGMIFRKKLCYIYLDRRQKGQVLGSVMVQADEKGREFTGMRSSWSIDRNALLIQRIRLIRLERSADNVPDAMPS